MQFPTRGDFVVERMTGSALEPRQYRVERYMLGIPSEFFHKETIAVQHAVQQARFYGYRVFIRHRAGWDLLP